MVVVQSVSHVLLFAIPWTPAPMPGSSVLHYLPEFAQVHVHWLVMLSNHLILCRSLLFFPSLLPSIRVFANESICSQRL